MQYLKLDKVLTFEGEDAVSFLDSLISNEFVEGKIVPSFLLFPDGKINYWFLTEKNGQVVNIFRPNSSENMVDNSSSPSFDGMIVTLKYGTSLTAKAEFNVYPNQDAVWPYKMIVNSDVDNIKLDNGITTAQIEAQVFNKTNTPLENMILSFSTNKGYIDSEGTTDSTGSVILTFQDNGSQDDIGLANIICSFNHPTFGAVSYTHLTLPTKA